MTVTMVHKRKGIEVSGVHLNFVRKWEELGFEIKNYESSKVVMLRTA